MTIRFNVLVNIDLFFVLLITFSFLYKDIDTFERKVTGFMMILLLCILLVRVVPLIWLATEFQHGGLFLAFCLSFL